MNRRLRRTLGTVTLSLVALAAGCGDSGDAATLVELPVLDAGSNGDSNGGATASTLPPTPLTTKPIAPPSTIDVPGLPKPVDIETTFVATAIETNGLVAVWDEPDASIAPAWSLAAPTEFGGPRHFAVLGEAVGADGSTWLNVQVPVRPNGTEGWIPFDAVQVAPVTTRVLIDLSDRSVIVWDGDAVVLDTTGAIGAAATPTPTGSYYIRDEFPWDPDSVYGPWVFALSSYSEVIDQINGGDAVVAIHGTRNNAVLGDAVSLGCIRLDNETLSLLADLVEPGTPVEVVP